MLKKSLLTLLFCLFIAAITMPKEAFNMSGMGMFLQTNNANTGSDEQPPGQIKVLFLGDMMFDRGVRAQVNKNGFAYIFGESTTTISAHDLTIANLEGPITSNQSATMKKGIAIPGFQFTFPTETAKALHDAGIDIVSLANNHTLNFGQVGLNETRRRLDEANVQYFGSPMNTRGTATGTSNQLATSTCTNTICVGLIGWHEFAPQNNALILSTIKDMRQKTDYLVVFPHWGAEYEHKPTEKQRLLARSWLDAGADAVMGAHPHVVQTIEMYKGRPIFYSLGNFIFDQYFSFDTTHGIAVSVELKKHSTGVPPASAQSPAGKVSASYKVLPFSSKGSKVSFPDSSSSEKIFESIRKSSASDISSWINLTYRIKQ